MSSSPFGVGIIGAGVISSDVVLQHPDVESSS